MLAGRAIGANTPQGCKGSVYTLDLVLSALTFYLQLLDYSGHACHVGPPAEL